MAAAQLSSRALYLQLADALSERIAAGEWKPHTAIPNEGDLAREYSVSPGTMRKALDLLESQRLLTRRQGRGTFVNDPASRELSNRFVSIRSADGEPIAGEVKSQTIAEGIANALECKRLGVGANESVYRISRVCLRKSRPFMVEQVAMPTALFPGLVDRFGATDGIAALAQQYGLLLGKAEERVTIDAASPEVAAALGIAPSAPVMKLDRVMLTLDGRAIEWRIGRCLLAGDYYLAEMR